MTAFLEVDRVHDCQVDGLAQVNEVLLGHVEYLSGGFLLVIFSFFRMNYPNYLVVATNVLLVLSFVGFGVLRLCTEHFIY